MGMSMRYTESDQIGVVLNGIENACEETVASIQKQSVKIIKTRIVGELNRIRRQVNEEQGITHMADDVQAITKKDRFGYPVAKVQGGKKSGTLWHIVNDGTYRSKAYHFMDNALSAAEPEIEALLDSELGKRL